MGSVLKYTPLPNMPFTPLDVPKNSPRKPMQQMLRSFLSDVAWNTRAGRACEYQHQNTISLAAQPNGQHDVNSMTAACCATSRDLLRNVWHAHAQHPQGIILVPTPPPPPCLHCIHGSLELPPQRRVIYCNHARHDGRASAVAVVAADFARLQRALRKSHENAGASACGACLIGL